LVLSPVIVQRGREKCGRNSTRKKKQRRLLSNTNRAEKRAPAEGKEILPQRKGIRQEPKTRTVQRGETTEKKPGQKKKDNIAKRHF